MTGPITSPTPWWHSSTGGAETIVDRTGQTVAILGRGMEPGNGALIVAAPDHALLLRAFSKGAVRWEPFNLNTRFVEDRGRGELCVNGLRYVTVLDEFGCPMLNSTIRAALAKEGGQ